MYTAMKYITIFLLLTLSCTIARAQTPSDDEPPTGAGSGSEPSSNPSRHTPPSGNTSTSVNGTQFCVHRGTTQPLHTNFSLPDNPCTTCICDTPQDIHCSVDSQCGQARACVENGRSYAVNQRFLSSARCRYCICAPPVNPLSRDPLIACQPTPVPNCTVTTTQSDFMNRSTPSLGGPLQGGGLGPITGGGGLGPGPITGGGGLGPITGGGGLGPISGGGGLGPITGGGGLGPISGGGGLRPISGGGGLGPINGGGLGIPTGPIDFGNSTLPTLWPRGCLYQGRFELLHANFSAADDCNTCACVQPNVIHCTNHSHCNASEQTEPRCEEDGRSYALAERFVSLRRCRACVCGRAGPGSSHTLVVCSHTPLANCSTPAPRTSGSPVTGRPSMGEVMDGAAQTPRVSLYMSLLTITMLVRYIIG